MISKSEVAAILNRLLRRFDVALVRPSEVWRITDFLGRQPLAGAARLARQPLTRAFGPDDGATQFDFAVIMPSILRPTIANALRSIFAQDFAGTVQTLIGVDQPSGEVAMVEAACRDRPPNHTVLLFDPGYSTSQRHGGLHPAWDGGVLRTVLSYLAASRRLAYLDDDNWWAPNHLSSLGAALEGHDWAWSRRWFADPHTRQPLAEDIWESVGPGAGVFGGWVDPNCLAIDKLACEAVLRWWGIPTRNSGTAWDADRNVFRILSSHFRGRASGVLSCNYTLTETDEHYARRTALIAGLRQ
ncbi:MAG: glycosyltransferase family A protein [Rhodopila sp.]|nr:glycosyltransferase family A protein [Rhodopila sp.]